MTAAAHSLREDLWNLPNILTYGRILVIPLVCWLMVCNRPFEAGLAAIVFGAAAGTDWLDGYIARKRNLVSMTGKFLDPLADKLLVTAVFVICVELGWLPAWFVIISLCREMAVTSLRALAAGEGMIIDAAWGGKWKTAFQLTGLSCLLIHFPYRINYGLFALDLRLDRVGFVLLLISLWYSLVSGWKYFKDFLAELNKRANAVG